MLRDLWHFRFVLLMNPVVASMITIAMVREPPLALVSFWIVTGELTGAAVVYKGERL